MRFWVFVVISVVMGGCSTREGDSDVDGGGDVVVDAGSTDGGLDAGIDAGLDAGIDAGTDGGLDAGADAGVDAGRCTEDADCLASEICHPTAKVCVQTCMSAADCPDSAKMCDALSATDSRQICKCATDVLCNEGRSTFDLVCSIQDAVCTPKCTADTECAEGQRCDTASGHCKVRGDSGVPCTGEGQSNCDYGTHYCTTGICVPLVDPTCANYQNFPNKDQLGTTGPILYDARRVSVSTDPAACGSATPKRMDIALSAYSSRPFPMLKSELSGFFRVMVEGSTRDGLSHVFPGNSYTVSGDNRERAELVVSLCAVPESITISSAFYFTNGNFLCHQANF
ncbi:hypothetical protein D7X96_12640 [Corallococcus interemptor]|uniref:CHP n=1 Tax=Corallococcus interemptor TaxID=2316720 RepID=A0A3A8QNS1_9BACT|nr:hypothetical protein [Corallococcus interemptor]RKH70177.1 hypothetical protein D7X96_12640 [Corallococcus interemptor]